MTFPWNSAIERPSGDPGGPGDTRGRAAGKFHHRSAGGAPVPTARMGKKLGNFSSKKWGNMKK